MNRDKKIVQGDLIAEMQLRKAAAELKRDDEQPYVLENGEYKLFQTKDYTVDQSCATLPHFLLEIPLDIESEVAEALNKRGEQLERYVSQIEEHDQYYDKLPEDAKDALRDKVQTKADKLKKLADKLQLEEA